MPADWVLMPLKRWSMAVRMSKKLVGPVVKNRVLKSEADNPEVERASDVDERKLLGVAAFTGGVTNGSPALRPFSVFFFLPQPTGPTTNKNGRAAKRSRDS